jgi:hypothetical protein
MEHSRIYSAPFFDDKIVGRANDIRDRLNSALRIVDQVASVPASRMPNQRVSEAEVRAMLKMRRVRNQFFDGELFADPAWDMLLELYAAELGQQRISVGCLCVGAAVPATTALRWITTLENKGLVERRADPLDGRRFHLSLSTSGLKAMEGYFGLVPVSPTII